MDFKGGGGLMTITQNEPGNRVGKAHTVYISAGGRDGVGLAPSISFLVQLLRL